MTSPRTPAPPQPRNRLGEETSPYLLQHRANPVHWFAWGPEAFEAARALDRPIFLSVGYSTCYWCHVMERESFENEEVAAILNEKFVSIKVDREERPDVDDIYMAAVQVFSGGHGGWPMTVFLEPHALKPFLGGTYFPPEDRQGRPGFTSLLGYVDSLWRERREEVLQQAERVAGAVSEQLASTGGAAALPGRRDVERAVAQLLSMYDHKDGGFAAAPARAPKFPIASTLDFLMGAAWDTDAVRRAVLHTLDRMALGGMFDQVGGGFHRYSTDARWLVPHFEKMLYDNGQLASTYAEASERTRDAMYARVLREVLDYVLREMTLPDGTFASAQDAEVNHREGQNYLWTAGQMRATLEEAGAGDLAAFAHRLYGVELGANFQDPHHPEDDPANVLFMYDRPDQLAIGFGLSVEELLERRARVNQALLAARLRRDQPLTDDKVLAGWNGLMIAGLADAGRVLGEPRYVEAAARAADRIRGAMRARDGGLLRTARAGQARIDAFAEDYAAMIRGLLALHRASGEARHLTWAAELAQAARERFWDESGGGYFDTLAARSDLFVRTKSSYDGALPCANSLMALNLLDLHQATGQAAHLDDAVATIQSLGGVIRERPTSAVLATLALHRLMERHPQRLGQPVAEAPATPAPSRFATAEPVTFRVEPNTVRVANGQPAAFNVVIEIARGFHINSNAPGIDFLIPLKIDLSGAQGLELEVAYPAGERFAGPEGPMFVHQGRVVVPVTVRQTGPVAGRPAVSMTWQVCTERECLAPRTERVAVAILSGS
jgi:hypothetical protein